MRRNRSMLQFQRRLIRTALKSPRAEAMKLFGIIYSNLREFIEVRVPLDDDPETLMDEFFDVLSTFDMALQRKFNRGYFMYDPDQIVNLASIDGSLEKDSSAMLRSWGPCHSAPDSVSPKIMVNGSDDYVVNASQDHVGAIINGMFYSIPALIGYNYPAMKDTEEGKWIEDYFNQHVDIIATSNMISAPPHGEVTDVEAALNLQKWLTTNHPVSVEVHFRYRPTQDSSLELESINEYKYMVYYRNPYFLNFDKTSDLVLQYMKTIPEYKQFFSYDEPGDDGVNVVGDHDDIDHTEVLRGPFKKTGYVIDRMIGHLPESFRNIVHDDSPEAATYASVVHNAKRLRDAKMDHYIQEFYMTIYRTGTDYVDINRRFILLISAILRKNAHIYIELRARGDEESNLNLYRDLLRVGADVHVVSPNYPSLKVHAKVWTMICPANNDPRCRYVVSLYSTGNFVESAQKGFADTYFIDRGTVLESNIHALPQISMMDDLFNSNKLRAASSDEMIWKPGDIRALLLKNIRTATLQAMAQKHHMNDTSFVRPFIYLKVNHITDPVVIQALSDAADCGVDVRIIARTTCTIPTSTSNIRVKSLTGRYLEHDRYFIFGGNGTYETWISSSDIMPRNLDDRIEYAFRVTSYTASTSATIMELFMKLWNSTSNTHDGVFSFNL